MRTLIVQVLLVQYSHKEFNIVKYHVMEDPEDSGKPFSELARLSLDLVSPSPQKNRTVVTREK